MEAHCRSRAPDGSISEPAAPHPIAFVSRIAMLPPKAMFPLKDRLTIGFAHVAYRLRDRFAARATGIASFEVRERAELDRRIGEVDVLVISGLWHDGLLAGAGKLRYIQSIGA